MKIDRLISIIMVLLQQKTVSASKLAKMFSVTTRTIYRDIETINLAGVPIVTYPGVHGGIGIMQEYKIDKKVFTATDVTNLLRGLSSISSTLSEVDIANTLAKVKSLVPKEHSSDVELKCSQIKIDLSPWTGNEQLQLNLATVKEAVSQNKLLSFEYLDRNGQKSQRQVEPYQLLLKAMSWYMQGYCRKRADFRLFKLTRMSMLVMQEEFLPRAFSDIDFSDASWLCEQKPIIKVTLLVEPILLERIEEFSQIEDRQEQKDGRVLIQCSFLADEEGYNFLLSFGDKCECLEPLEVRQELVKRIKKVLSIYI